MGVHSWISDARTIPSSVIVDQTKLSVEDVDHLLGKSLSFHLIEGIIDQVESTVHVSSVQPRVLGMLQIKSLRDRLDVGKDVKQAWHRQSSLRKHMICGIMIFDRKMFSAHCNNFLREQIWGSHGRWRNFLSQGVLEPTQMFRLVLSAGCSFFLGKKKLHSPRSKQLQTEGKDPRKKRQKTPLGNQKT